ncbi:hypothetical protein B5V01_08190 [Mesorhizobium erdmanii]|uniref:Uncharacterized protein n=2 Tax=Mesorhizobium TaxID=68287 RepID=A0A3M9X3Y8_9HYPH|nr:MULTISPECIES: hypothetical protein [Mesorhizobium]RNJ42386.1 hypothetical protein DNR46_28735 [Mesorhizobium japonicum]RXT47932.1 hypothetical protein B5V01_08190 [Mesorhizobium erdmanii]
MQNFYDAFISYRRAEASALANWIRNRLQRYRLPKEVLEMLSSEKRELHQRRPRIYVDRIYEKPAEDFLQDKIYPALDASQRLIVLSTPSAFDTIKDAGGVETPNWLVREIDRFMGPESATRHRPVDLVLGPLRQRTGLRRSMRTSKPRESKACTSLSAKPTSAREYETNTTSFCVRSFGRAFGCSMLIIADASTKYEVADPCSGSGNLGTQAAAWIDVGTLKSA